MLEVLQALAIPIGMVLDIYYIYTSSTRGQPLPYQKLLQRVYMFSMTLGCVLIQAKNHADTQIALCRNRFLLSAHVPDCRMYLIRVPRMGAAERASDCSSATCPLPRPYLATLRLLPVPKRF